MVIYLSSYYFSFYCKKVGGGGGLKPPQPLPLRRPCYQKQKKSLEEVKPRIFFSYNSLNYLAEIFGLKTFKTRETCTLLDLVLTEYCFVMNSINKLSHDFSVKIAYKLHSTGYGLRARAMLLAFDNFTCAYLSQIALEIM